MAQVRGSTVVITGASSGIGRAAAYAFAAGGARVVLAARRADVLDDVVREIRDGGGEALAIPTDVPDPDAVAALAEGAERAFGGIDVWINNAGAGVFGPLLDAPLDLHRQTIAINLKGVFNGLREAARRLRDGGRIISFSSSVVGLYQPGYAVYAATKAGVEAMTHVLAKELGPRRIAVNAVAPGPIATDLFLKDKSDADIAPIVGRTPLGRLGEPEDVAAVVSFLASPEGGWINGQVLRANGGLL